MSAFLGVGVAHDSAGFIAAIDRAIAKRSTPVEQIAFAEKLANLLATPAFSSSSAAELFDELHTYTTNKKRILQGKMVLTPPPLGKTRAIKPSGNSSSLVVDGVEAEKIRTAFLDWHQQERNLLALPAYRYHSELEKSAQARANQLRDEGRTTHTHTRAPDTRYYHVESIKNWFDTQDINFVNDSFSESVGWGYYACKSSSCTQELIKSLASSWEFFMSEKGRGGPHYKAIANKSFVQFGVGVAIDPAKKRYYLVIHYGTELLE